jgi:hypothetical protein
MAETKFQTKSADKMLLLKDKVSNEVNTYSSTGQGSPLGNAAGVASPLWATIGSPTGTIVGSMPIYNELGQVMGYVPLFDTANLA